MDRRPESVLRRGAKRKTAALALAAAALVLVLATPSAAADTTPPIVTYTIDGTAGANGWYRGSTHGDYVVVHWSVSDPDGPLLSTTGCDPAVPVDGPTPGVTRTCTATSDGGTTSVTTRLIKIDADPPAVSAAAVRPPDANGWYNHPITVAWSGTDATSGVAACTSIDYRGPDVGAGVLTGNCTDNAGNVASSTFALKYDATPPALSRVSVASGVGFDVVRWKSSSPSDTAVIARVARGQTTKQLVFRGGGSRFVDKKVRAATEYHYLVQTFDEAGNASRAASVMALPKILDLQAQPYVPRAAARPVLRWSRVKRATYYHVQLFRGSKRILAAWPLSPQLRLPARWTWSGRKYRLAPGKYRWFAWAGFGRRTAVRYRLLGSAKFIVP